MATFTPAQFAAQGGVINQPNSGANTAYQNFVKQNIPGAVQPPAPVQDKGTALSNANNFAGTLGMQKAGQSIATSINTASGLGNTGGNIASQSLQDTDKLIGQLHQMITSGVPATDPKRIQLANILKQSLNEQPTTQAEIDPGSTLSNREVLGSFLNIGALLAGGELAGGEEGAIATGLKEGVIQGAKTGAIGGSVVGGLGGLGSGLQDKSKNAGQVLGDTLKGGAEGAALGGAIGGTIPIAAEGFKAGQDAADNLVNKAKASSEAPKVEKLSPEQQDLQNNVTQSQKDLEQAKSKADFAAEQRKAVTPQAVEGVKDINTKVKANVKTLGENFSNDALKLSKTNPDLKLNLTNEQVDALNALKENKNFSLPKSIEKNGSEISLGGQAIDMKTMNPTTAAAIQKELGGIQGKTAVSLSPSDAQDLIKELNRSTFKQAADGSLVKDYQRIGITNEIKNAASQSFGSKWDDIYSKYSQGRSMIDKIDSIHNLDPNATPEDLNKQLEGILKQSKTPEGKLLLQQSINEYQKANGVDLKDPIKTIQQIADKQTALDDANSALSDAQKEANQAQRKADIAKLKQQQTMSTFKGRHPVLTQNLQYFGKRAAWGLTGGAVIGALGLSGILKKVFAGK